MTQDKKDVVDPVVTLTAAEEDVEERVTENPAHIDTPVTIDITKDDAEKLDEIVEEVQDKEEVKVIYARFEGVEALPAYNPFPFLSFSKAGLIFKLILALGFIAYCVAALVLDFERAKPLLWIIIAIVVYYFLKVCAKIKILTNLFHAIRKRLTSFGSKATALVYAVLIGICVVISLILARDDLSRALALLGLLALILLCYVFSWNRSGISWRPVFWGFLLQFIFGVLILRTTPGAAVFEFFGTQVAALQKYVNVGTAFVFGDLLLEKAFFAFNVLPVIIFYSGLASMLFYFGILQKFTLAVGNLMSYTMGTSAPESLSAAGNIFLGQTESPLLIRPYLKTMTNSEIHAVMTGGFATIAGGVLVSFVGFGVPADHLLSASVMSAPAALAISKIVYPESIAVDDTSIDKLDIGENYSNVIEAFSRGTSVSIALISNIVVNLIGFLALIAFLNTATVFLLTKVNVEGVNFETLMGYVCSPFALLMGIPIKDAVLAGELIGVKAVSNEFLAFDKLTKSNLDPDSKTFTVLTYALCGFSNFSSIGIQLGGLGAMEPSKITQMAKLALSAMICGNIACFMTACIASVLLPIE